MNQRQPTINRYGKFARMKSFAPILKRLEALPDPRQTQGRRYALIHVLLFSILAIVTSANSYRGIETFIGVHPKRLNAAFLA